VAESRLGLGTVQFGVPYGIANRTGRAVPAELAAAILGRAAAAGINTLDTAVSYGDSEAVLGAIGVSAWRVVSKLPLVPDGCPDVEGWMRTAVVDSLRRLKLDRLYGLLLHHPQQLVGRHGAALAAALVSLRDSGTIEKIGVSIYAPEELDAYASLLDLDLVQAPFNVMDRRLATSGWLARLQNQGTEVHVRSIFLQGLLLMDPAHRPPYFARWHETWDLWHEWLRAQSLTALQACVAFAFSYSGIQRVFVGVDSLQQFEEILEASDVQTKSPPVQLATDDCELVDPSKWTVR
jgi:aryl-alcohol dehydrogenase-like predicted oxidoreductase